MAHTTHKNSCHSLICILHGCSRPDEIGRDSLRQWPAGRRGLPIPCWPLIFQYEILKFVRKFRKNPMGAFLRPVAVVDSQITHHPGVCLRTQLHRRACLRHMELRHYCLAIAAPGRGRRVWLFPHSNASAPVLDIVPLSQLLTSGRRRPLYDLTINDHSYLKSDIHDKSGTPCALWLVSRNTGPCCHPSRGRILPYNM
jgi:hypothetical protein